MPEAFELKEQGHVLEVTLCRGKANTTVSYTHLTLPTNSLV